MQIIFNPKQLMRFKKELKIQIQKGDSSNVKRIKEIVGKLAKLYEVSVYFNLTEKCYGCFYPMDESIRLNLTYCIDLERTLITFFHELAHYFQAHYCGFCWIEDTKTWHFPQYLKFERTACRVSRALFLHHITNIYPSSAFVHSYRSNIELTQLNDYIRYNTPHCHKIVHFLHFLGFSDKVFARDFECYSRHLLSPVSITINHSKEMLVLLTKHDRLEIKINGTAMDMLIGYFIRLNFFPDNRIKEYFNTYI